MATDKPRFTITLDEETLDRVNEYKRDNRISTQSKAISSLVKSALDDLRAEGGQINRAPLCTSEALQLAKDFDELDYWGRVTVRKVVDAEKGRCQDVRYSTSKRRNAIPLRISVQPVSAGTGAYLGPEEFDTIFVLENEITKRASFGVPVRGDSMEPLYHDGDILIIDGSKAVSPGEIGVFTVGGEGFVKRLGDDSLVSLNTAYAPIPLDEETRCNGMVIGIVDTSWILK